MSNKQIDVLVPDSQVREEFGGISRQTVDRWDKDPEMAALGWPPPVRIRQYKHRSRNMLETFKNRLVEQAIRERAR
jgi:hypothetical protein